MRPGSTTSLARFRAFRRPLPRRLESAGGAWEGRATGVYSADRGDSIVFWYTGTGAFSGLTYFELLTGGPTWTIWGQVFPGSPPTP